MSPLTDSERKLRDGMVYAVLAYSIWGLFPLYWKMLSHLPSPFILAHRIVWATVFFSILILVRRKPVVPLVRRLFVSGGYKLLGLSALLIAANWLIYIYSVNSGHVLQASLGYFITPFVNVALGRFFLSEKIRRAQWVAVALALVGVVQLVILSGSIPYIAVSIAMTFGFYGLVRKKIAMDPLVASALEGALLFGPALFFLARVSPSVSVNSNEVVLLAIGGIVTGLPLLWFAEAASRLPLSVMGFFQYIVPITQFFIAVLLFHEKFSLAHFAGFAWVWAAIALFMSDLRRSSLKEKARRISQLNMREAV